MPPYIKYRINYSHYITFEIPIQYYLSFKGIYTNTAYSADTCDTTWYNMDIIF